MLEPCPRWHGRLPSRKGVRSGVKGKHASQDSIHIMTARLYFSSQPYSHEPYHDMCWSLLWGHNNTLTKLRSGPRCLWPWACVILTGYLLACGKSRRSRSWRHRINQFWNYLLAIWKAVGSLPNHVSSVYVMAGIREYPRHFPLRRVLVDKYVVCGRSNSRGLSHGLFRLYMVFSTLPQLSISVEASLTVSWRQGWIIHIDIASVGIKRDSSV